MRVADYRMLHLSRANLFTVVGGICRLGTFAYSDDRPKIVYFNIIYIMRIYEYGAGTVRTNKANDYKTRKRGGLNFRMPLMRQVSLQNFMSEANCSCMHCQS